MSDVLLQIQVLKDGTIQAVDAEGKPLPKMSPEDFYTKLPGNVIKKAELCTILYTNPCGWAYVNGQWYYRCW